MVQNDSLHLAPGTHVESISECRSIELASCKISKLIEDHFSEGKSIERIELKEIFVSEKFHKFGESLQERLRRSDGSDSELRNIQTLIEPRLDHD